MNSNEQHLQYPWGEVQPEPGQAQEIDGRQGWTIIDCGISRDEVKTLWEQVFTNALEGLPVLRVLMTHVHPDHVGLAHWLCKCRNAPLWMNMTDYMVASLCSSRHSGAGVGPDGQAAVDHFARHGLTDTDVQEKFANAPIIILA